MPASLFARRYLFSSGSRSVVNLISGLSIVAVAVPVAAMVVLLSVFNGFGTLIRSVQSVFDPPLTILPCEGSTFETTALDTAALRGVPRAGALSFILEQRALAEHEGSRAVVTVRGADENYGQVVPLAEAVVAGNARLCAGDAPRLLVGRTMAYRLGIPPLAEADVALYAVRRGSYSMLLPFENYVRQELPVGGVFELDLESETTYVLTSLDAARTLFRYPGRASALAVGTDAATAGDTQQLRTLRTAVAAAAGPGFRVLTAAELRPSLYRIMAYEKRAIFVIALFVLLIASFSVVGALTMLIVDKRHDIATLRTLGADRTLLRAIFRREGWLICTLGGAGGLLLGILLAWGQQRFGWIALPEGTFLMQSYPVELRAGDLAAVALSFAAVAWLLTELTVRNLIKTDATS